MHTKTIRHRCTACNLSSQEDATHCHECKGKRYIEYPGIVCHGIEEREAMTGGWYCPDCGASGPN